jgi:hypothetical protein
MSTVTADTVTADTSCPPNMIMGTWHMALPTALAITILLAVAARGTAEVVMVATHCKLFIAACIPASTVYAYEFPAHACQQV